MSIHPRLRLDVTRGVIAFAVGALCAPAFASPFLIRDQNPLLAGFDIPAALPARVPEAGQTTFDTTLAWGNTALLQTGSRETLIVDAETRELRLRFGRTLANGIALQLDAPMRQTTAGSLDSFIDGWHDFFSLPEGARPTMPRDALRVTYERDDRTLIDTRDSRSGIGDLSLRVGKDLGALPITGWVGLKMPTGDANDFSGSGSWDVTAALALAHPLSSRYGFFAQAAATWMSAGDRIGAFQKQFVWSGMAGLSANLLENLMFVVQIDAHTAVFDSDQDFLGDAVALTLGGRYRLLDDWELAFGVTEDIAVESTSDVVFQFELRKTW